MDIQLPCAVALMALAIFGFQFEMQVPEWVPILGSAIIGSIQAVAVRVKKGFIEGKWAVSWAILAGISCGMFFGQAIGSIMGLNENVAIILPVYFFSLIGSRLVMWLSTDVDVPSIGQSIVNLFTPSKK